MYACMYCKFVYGYMYDICIYVRTYVLMYV